MPNYTEFVWHQSPSPGPGRVVELDEQIGRLPWRSFRLAVAAFLDLAPGQLAMSIFALGAYEAHPGGEGVGAAGRSWWYIGWLAEGRNNQSPARPPPKSLPRLPRLPRPAARVTTSS